MFPINILSQPPFVKNGFCSGSWITRTISRNLVDFALNADCQGNHATVQSTQSHRPLHISTKQIHEAHLIQNYIDWYIDVSNLMFIVGEKGGQNNGEKNRLITSTSPRVVINEAGRRPGCRTPAACRRCMLPSARCPPAKKIRKP